MDMFLINFVHLAKNLRQGFQNWFLPNYGNALTKTTVFAKIAFVLSVWFLSIENGVWCSCFFHFETVSQKRTVFWGKSSADSSKLHFYLSRRNRWIKVYLEKKFCFVNFGHWAKIFPIIDGKILTALSKWQYACPGIVSRKMVFWTVFGFFSNLLSWEWK